LDFEWWIRQAGAESVRGELIELLRSRPKSVQVNFDTEGKPQSFIEPVLVARFEQTARC